MGEINSCKIVRRRTSDPSRCIAHVSFFRASSYAKAFDYLVSRPMICNPAYVFKSTEGTWCLTSPDDFAPTNPSLTVFYPETLSSDAIKQFFNDFGAKSFEPKIPENDTDPIGIQVLFNTFFQSKLALESLIDAELCIQDVPVIVDGLLTESLPKDCKTSPKLLRSPQPPLRSPQPPLRSPHISPTSTRRPSVNRRSSSPRVSNYLTPPPSPKQHRSVSPSSFFEEPTRPRRSPHRSKDNDRHRKRHGFDSRRSFPNLKDLKFRVSFDRDVLLSDVKAFFESVKGYDGLVSVNGSSLSMEFFVYFKRTLVEEILKLESRSLKGHRLRIEPVR
ncbi:hypothetical protein GEMRC1_011480 [Eukaryota sp. GEM-RC1]